MAGAYFFHASQTGMCGHILCREADLSSKNTRPLILETTKAGTGR